MSRRFSVVRARLLLFKQQRVVVLEKQLEELDRQESRPLYLGSFQEDASAPRLQVLRDLDKALADYGKSYSWSLSLFLSPRRVGIIRDRKDEDGGSEYEGA